MTRHAYGVGPAGFCALSAVRKTADDNECNAPKEVCDIPRRNTYIDDTLYSHPDPFVLKSHTHDLIKLYKSGKFVLRKILSNSKPLIASLPDELLASNSKDIALHGLPTKSTLGLKWDAQCDNFGVKVDLKDKPKNWRGLLSQLHSIFTPLGMLQPFTLPMKCLFQELQVLDYDWDTELSASLLKPWLAWSKDLPKLNDLILPRAFSYRNNYRSLELHCFSDASTKGYASVYYLRFIYDNTDIIVSFALGKCRIVPKRRCLTVPNLELQSAVISVRLASVLQAELDLTISSISYWVDSTTVLKYIGNEDARYKVYVANRVKFIRAHTEIDQWHYIPTSQNPSDIGSRGVMPHEMMKITPWLEGPSFLQKDRSTWEDFIAPNSSEALSVLANDLVVEELIQEERSPVIPGLRATLSDLIVRYSVWLRLRKALHGLFVSNSGLLLSKLRRNHFQRYQMPILL